MSQTHDSRRDRLFALQMQIAIAKRERDEVRGRPFPDPAEVAEHEAKIGQLQDQHFATSWHGAP